MLAACSDPRYAGAQELGARRRLRAALVGWRDRIEELCAPSERMRGR